MHQTLKQWSTQCHVMWEACNRLTPQSFADAGSLEHNWEAVLGNVLQPPASGTCQLMATPKLECMHMHSNLLDGRSPWSLHHHSHDPSADPVLNVWVCLTACTFRKGDGKSFLDVTQIARGSLRSTCIRWQRHLVEGVCRPCLLIEAPNLPCRRLGTGRPCWCWRPHRICLLCRCLCLELAGQRSKTRRFGGHHPGLVHVECSAVLRIPHKLPARRQWRWRAKDRLWQRPGRLFLLHCRWCRWRLPAGCEEVIHLRMC
jgi:hypothetical protein